MKLFNLFVVLLFSSTNSYSVALYQIGNSLTYDSYPHRQAFVNVANNNGQNITDNGWHVRASKQLNYIYENPDDPLNLVGPSGNWQTSLSSGKWDVVTIQPYHFGTSSLETDTNNIVDWMNLASTANSNTSFYIYSAWPEVSETVSYSDQWLSGSENINTQKTLMNRAYFQNLQSSIESATNTSIGIIPIGEVWYQIEQLANTNQLNNITSAYDLYRDKAHANNIGRSVIAWTMYASIFDESAVGIDLTDIYLQESLTKDKTLVFQLQSAVDSVVFANPVPIPSSVSLFFSGLIGLILLVRRKPIFSRSYNHTNSNIMVT